MKSFLSISYTRRTKANKNVWLHIERWHFNYSKWSNRHATQRMQLTSMYDALEYEMRQINERVVKSMDEEKQKMYYINWMYMRDCASHCLKHSKTALIDTLNDRVSLCNTDELCKCTSIARIYKIFINIFFVVVVQFCAHKPNVGTSLATICIRQMFKVYWNQNHEACVCITLGRSAKQSLNTFNTSSPLTE